MDFDAEIAKFLGTTQMKRNVRSFAATQMKSFMPGTVKAMGEAESWAKKARDEIIAFLPDELRNSPTHPIGADDLYVYPGEVTDDGSFQFLLGWNPYAVHRDSLYDEEYPDGIEDIVGLFTTGYQAKNQVYGWWDHHYYAYASSYSGRSAGFDTMWTRSRQVRSGDPFLQTAIDKFNAEHKKDGVHLEILPSAKYYH